MKVIRTDPFTGSMIEREIDVTQAQLNQWYHGAYIQDVMPRLTADEREFIMTGYAAASWNSIFNLTRTEAE